MSMFCIELGIDSRLGILLEEAASEGDRFAAMRMSVKSDILGWRAASAKDDMEAPAAAAAARGFEEASGAAAVLVVVVVVVGADVGPSVAVGGAFRFL